MSAPVRIGLIGAGRIAEQGHAPAIAATPTAVLTAVADPDADRRQALAQSTGADAFATPEELVQSGSVDAVVVAGPAELHVEHARLAARAGLPCLVEKPPAPDADGARELAGLHPAPWVGFNRRFHQGAELLNRVPADGPLELELELRYRRGSWRPHQVRDEALLDLAPHLVDLALLFGGAPAEVESATLQPERALIELQTARGRAVLRCATDRAHLERVTVARPDGTVLARSQTGGVARGALARFRSGPHPLVASLTRQLKAFVAVVTGGDPGLLASADDGAQVMEVIAQAAAAGGGSQGTARSAVATT